MNGTVAAISTPPGRGGVAIIRISGADAFSVAEKVFSPANKAAFAKRSQARAYYGSFRDRDGVFDDGLCVSCFRRRWPRARKRRAPASSPNAPL